MNLVTMSEIAEKLEKWADQEIPDLVPGPKLAPKVSLDRLLSDKVDALIKTLRLDGKTEWAKVIREDYDRLRDAVMSATLDLVKRIVVFKVDRLNKRHDELSSSDILDPNFKTPAEEPWNEGEIPGAVYFDECSSCAHQLARTLGQVAKTARKERNKYILGKIMQLIPVARKVWAE